MVFFEHSCGCPDIPTLSNALFSDVLRQALAPIKSQIHIALIYGSIAKQEDTATSDIDLMLIHEKIDVRILAVSFYQHFIMAKIEI